MTHILIAPNAFKGSLDAAAAARAIEEGLKASALKCTTTCFPIADGGDGTCRLLMNRFDGEEVRVQVADPLGRLISSTFGLINDRTTAVIEMANASGLRLLSQSELNPLIALSTGTGELMKAALDRGVKKMIITMGGSATVDGGVGMMQALGALFLDHDRQPLRDLPGSLAKLRYLDLTQVDARIRNCEIIVLCDVNNQLLGEFGAASVFGPQKGASREQVHQLDNGLTRLATIVISETGRDMRTALYGGTAGGAAAGLFAMLNARLVNGIDYFLDITNFDEALKSSTIVVTAEGRIDEQTLQGKGPYGVAVRAQRYGVPVVGFAGQVQDNKSESLQKFFHMLIPINDSSDLSAAMRNTRHNLTSAALELGNALAAKA